MDLSVLQWVNDFARGAVGRAIGVALSSRWMLVLVGVPLLVVFGRKRNLLAIATITVAMGLTDIVTSRVLKPAVGRPRPCHIMETLATPDGCGPGKSFPSGHASNAFALASSASMFWRPAAWVLVPIAAGVAGSRVLIGVHYPSDIIVGAMLGTLLGLFLSYFAKKRFLPQNSQSSDDEEDGLTDQ